MKWENPPFKSQQEEQPTNEQTRKAFTMKTTNRLGLLVIVSILLFISCPAFALEW